MIGYLEGILLEKRPDHIILLTGTGVGYEVEVPASSLCLCPPLKQKIALHILTHVREESFRLFGFMTFFDKRVFSTLLQVSGIGPKAALALLGSVDGFELCEMVVHQQLSRLTATPGIGAKTAERLVLELKTKLQKLMSRYEGDRPPTVPGEFLFSSDSSSAPNGAQISEKIQRQQVVEDLKSALGNLGYKEKQYLVVVEHFAKKIHAGENLPFEIALKQVLKKLSEHVLKN